MEEPENIETKKSDAKPKKPHRKKLMTILYFIVFSFIGIIFLASVTIVLISRTDFFRRWTTVMILNLANDNLEGKIQFRGIRFGFNNLTLYDFKLFTAGDTLVSTPEITVRYKLLPLIDKKLIINNVEIKYPRVKLLRSLSDSTWNFQHIAKPNPDTTVSPPPNLTIDVDNLNISDAYLIFRDSTVSGSTGKQLNFADIKLKKFNLKAKADIKLADLDFHFIIDELDFIETHSGFNLKNLTAEAYLNKSGIHLENLELEAADCKLSLRTRLDSLNIFGTAEEADINNAKFYIKLDAEKLNLSDMNYFIYLPIRIQGEYAAKCEVSGKLADISVNKLDIKGNDTKLLIKSRFLNVFNPDKFKFDTKIESAEINYTELSRLLPDIDFAPIPDFKNMIIEETNIFGKPDSISVKLNSRCALANIKFNGGIGIKSSDLSYSGNLELTNLNLQPILKSSEFVSTINANIEVKGSGTEFDKIKSSILLKLENSRIGNITVDNCNLACSVHDKGIISLDTFNIILDNRIDKESFYTDDFSKISASGLLNLQQPLKPLYEINCEFKGLNLRKILKNNAVPQFLGGAITLNGSGFEPDSIECLLNAAISDCMFGDRSLMGFDTRLSVERFEGNNRAIHINSDYLKLDLDGDFTINNLVASLVRQSLCIANFAMNKAKAFIPEDSVKIDTVPLIADSAGFFPADFTISANVKDISPVGALVDGLSLFVNSDFKIHYHSDFESCKVSIDSMKINNFGINVPGVSIIANNAFIKGGYYIERTDSAPKVRNMDMRFLSNSSVNISGSLFSKPKVSLELIGENAAINASSTFNQQVGFYSSGLLEFKNGSGLEMLIDSLSVSYADLFRWHNTGRLISLDFERSGFNIKDLALIRDNAEQLFVTGRIGVSHTDNFKILLKNYNLSDALKWIPDNKDKMLNTLSGKVDSISILIHGDYTAPIIEAGISCDNLSFAGINFGNLRSGLTYRNSRISGNLSLFNKAINPNEDLLTAEIKAIPVDLSITDIKDRFHRRFPIDIRTRIRKLPLELISPFVRQVAENLAGYAEGTLDIGGYLPDEFVYNGNIGITEAAFTLLPTSIRYYAEGDIKVDEDKIIIDKIELKNTGDISSRGNATLSGSMIIDKFIPKELDFSIAASNLTVLSDASVRNLPTLYGDLVISTGEKNLRFYGTLSQPNIEGDIDIMKADLKLPQLGGASQTAHSAFKYIIKQKGKIIYSGTDSIPTDFSKSKSQKTGSAGQSDGGGANFADLMDFNINVRFLGKCDVKMDLGTLSQLYAEIGTSDRTEAINYVKRRNDKQAYLYGGDIFVKKGSTLKLYKLLNTSGKVSFPAGSMDNPGLDLVADYNGQTTTKDKTRNFTVRAFLTGTKNNPNIRFTYLIDGEEATGDTTQITSDAIFLMLVGKKKSDYLENNSQGNFLMDLGSDVTNSGLSMVGSKFLTDVLSGSGIIQNADIDFGGGDPKIKFSGQLFGNVRWKFGGTVLDLMGNNEFSIEMPLGAFFNTDYQIDAQFSHSTNESGSQSLDRKDWEVKLKVGKTW